MSTLSGIVSKGEKGKPKFQSLDINSLYRGESLEPHQAKSTLPRKHGMQSLGKVPSARRPPANLPSLKSEHSGNDPAISLVPTGGSGWGSKPGETGPPPPHLAAAAAQQQAEQNQAAAAAAAPAPQPPPAAAAIAPSVAPPQVVAPPAPTQGPTHQLPIQVQQPPHQHASASDKSWSSVMSGPGEGGGGVRPPSFLAHQSPQFQHEFPKLSSGDGLAPPTGQKGGSDTQYGPGPSLRPQTEGSWIQGGGRPGAAGGPLPSSGGGPSPGGAGPAPGHPGADPGGARTSSGQSAALGGPMGPAGHPGGMQQQGPMPHQFRGVLPQFMYTQRGNFPGGGGGFPPNFPPGGGGGGPIVHGLPRQRFPYPPDGRFMRPGGGGHHEDDSATAPRPIIKEEELSKMDDIARDPGWATHDDIDYNQKLAFSDDEDTHKDETVRGGGGKDSSRSLSHSSSKEDKRSMEREGDSMERDSDRKPPQQQHPSMRGERERSGPPADHRGPPPPASQDQRQQQGWQQGRGPLPPGDFRGGPQGPQPVAAMRPAQQQGPPPRLVEDEEIWRERRRHQSEEVAIAVERAKQRKEEEEKRYEESRAAALQKLQQLEQKMGERARTSESKDEPAAPAPAAPSPAPVSVSVIPLPDWERERERSRTSSSEGKEDKAARDARDAAEFRQLTQVGGDRGPFMRPTEAPGRPSEAPLPPRGSAPAPTERDRDLRPHEQPVFSRQFQSNLPPRFQKQQAERTERHQFVRPSAAAPSTAAPTTPPAAQGFDPRWAGSGPAQHFQGQQAGGGGSKSGGHASAPPRRSSESERDSDRPPSRDQPPSRDRQPQRPHPQDAHDRDYRPDQQRPRGNYSDSQRKGNYYEGQDYQRSYSREHERIGARDEPERQHWERDARQYDERREADNKEGYDRHMEEHEPRRELHRQESGGEWRGEGGGGGEWKREREPPKRERDDRPQRPDSRDSRASKESRTSREDKPLQHGPDSDHKYQQAAKGESWADAPLDGKEDKKKQAEYYRGGDDRGRHHAPGPITREKLEAAERGGEMKRNLTQLRRGNATSQDAKQSDSQVDKKERKPNEPSHAWHQSGQLKNTDRPSQSHLDSRYNAEMSKSWADALPDPEPPQPPPQQLSDQGDQHDNKEDMDADKPMQEGGKKPSEGIEGKHYDDDKSRSRTGGSRQNYGGGGGGGSYAIHRSWGAAPPSSRGRAPRGGGAVAPGGRRPQEWGHSESEYSGDEVSASTESGKEDASAVRSAAQRPDKGKGEKDDRNRDARREGDKGGDPRRYEKRGTAGYESVRGGRDGFAPRGEPSRRGRGGFRTRGSVARRMDGYGPPSSKSPFGGTHDEKLGNKDNRKTDGSSKEDLDGEIMNAEDKMKLKQQALSAGIIGSGARQAGKGPAAQVPPRMQRKSESERRDSSRSKTRSSRGRDGARLLPRSAPRQNSSDHGEENWETTSENSDLDDPRGRRDGGGKKPYPLPAREPQPGRPRVVGSGGVGRQPTNPSRAPGAEKAPRSSNNGYGAAPGRAPMMGGSANGGGRGPSSRGPVSGGGTKLPMKDGGGVVVAIQRLDEVKIHDPALVAQAIADLNAQKKAATRPEKEKANQLEGLDLNNYANNGFQEVRSKKNVKEARQKVEEASAAAANQKTAFASGSPVIGRSAAAAADKDRKPKPLLQEARSQDVRSSQQDARPAPREGVVVKAAFERPRQSKLPPRLAKQRENNRLQKQQQQQHGGMHSTDVNEMNLINQNISLFPMKDHAPPPVNAWDKPLRPNSPSLGQGMQLGGLTNTEACGLDPSEAPHSGGSSQRSTPHEDTAKLSRDGALDGTSPPVQTIIFENTNYKTAAPQDAAMKAKFGGGHAKNQKGHKMDDGGADTTAAALGYGNKSGSLSDLGGPDMKSDAIQMPLSFGKEDSSDMKLDFFDSELSQLTEDGGGKKGLGLARAMHNMAPGGGGGGQNPTADLNFKIASVKKVWENMPTVQEHTEDGNAVSSSASTFPPSFGNAVDMGLEQSFGKSADCPQDDGSSGHNPGEVVYSHHPHSPGPPQQGGGAYGGGGVVVMNAKNDPTSSNVCKVKPQQQTVMAGVGVHPGPMSPPPFNAANPAPGHINYQATLGGGANQFGGLSAIPSPPTVLYNSSQQLASQGGLYGAFQIDGGQVLGGQARSQFSQFPPYGLTQGLGQTSAFNQQSMYLTSPHPPPSNAQDMYQTSLSQYRIQPGQGPFGQSQPLSNNQSTVMISSASNSLMSASVKPSAQQIGAIGTKGGVPYQTASMPATQPPSQMYIQYDPSQVMGQSYLSSSQLVQRPGPVQSNVVPSIQPSSSYYSGSAPGQGAFYQAASSSIQPPPQQPTAQQLHQSGGSPYGLQGYTTQSANGSMQSFGSQMAQPYRTAGLPAPPAYMKPPANQHVMSDAAPQQQQQQAYLKMADHSGASNGRSQLKSPSTNEAVMQSVFSGGAYPPQIPSPKSRNNMNKQQQQPVQQQQQQQSPTQQQQHKYGSYQTAAQSAQMAYQQGVRSQLNLSRGGGVPQGMAQPPPRYPPPIQRPNVAYQQVAQQQQQQQQQQTGANMMGSRHRPQHNTTSRPPPNVNKIQNYYGGHSNLKIDSNTEGKQEINAQQSVDTKLSEVSSAAGAGNATGIKPAQPVESKMAVDAVKDESSTPATE